MCLNTTKTTTLNTLKYDLQDELDDSYLYASADRSICPDISVCYWSISYVPTQKCFFIQTVSVRE